LSDIAAVSLAALSPAAAVDPSGAAAFFEQAAANESAATPAVNRRILRMFVCPCF
jgi:hypothetical protein